MSYDHPTLTNVDGTPVQCNQDGHCEQTIIDTDTGDTCSTGINVEWKSCLDRDNNKYGFYHVLSQRCTYSNSPIYYDSCETMDPQDQLRLEEELLMLCYRLGYNCAPYEDTWY